MIQVTNHAIERYIERVMELDFTTISDIQYKAVRETILDILLPRIDMMEALGYGTFKVDGVDYVLHDHKIVTVKINKPQREFNGKAFKSGRKVKKFKKVTRDERKNTK